jgi:hypothetical protein
MTTVQARITCVACNGCFVIEVDAEHYNRWHRGEGNIQDIMPELSAADRELLLSGTCSLCFDKMFECEGDEE